MVKVNIKFENVFKVDYENNKEVNWDYNKDLLITDKTEFIKSFERWYKIKPYLQDEIVRKAIIYGFKDTFDTSNYPEVMNGEFEPYRFNYLSIEDEDFLEGIGDSEYLIKHDRDNSRVYKQLNIGSNIGITLSEIYGEYGEGIISKEEMKIKLDDVLGRSKEETKEEEVEEYAPWATKDSWYCYSVAHRCQHMAYYEVEFGKILEPKLEWWIVHTNVHGFAIGVNEQGHVDYIYDMSWYWYEKDQDINEFSKMNELL